MNVLGPRPVSRPRQAAIAGAARATLVDVTQTIVVDQNARGSLPGWFESSTVGCRTAPPQPYWRCADKRYRSPAQKILTGSENASVLEDRTVHSHDRKTAEILDMR
jgi:hypothetical protein